MMLKHTLAAALIAGAVATPAAAQTLRFGHANSPGEVAHDLFNELAERVNKRTNGAVTIRVFPSEQLGKEADLVQQIKSGALDISAPSMPVMSSLVPAMEMASGPFLWRDWKEADAVIRGAAFDPLYDELATKHNIVPLTRIFYWGWRNFTFTDREVRKPEDMAGLKIRVPESRRWQSSGKAAAENRARPTLFSALNARQPAQSNSKARRSATRMSAAVAARCKSSLRTQAPPLILECGSATA